VYGGSPLVVSQTRVSSASVRRSAFPTPARSGRPRRLLRAIALGILADHLVVRLGMWDSSRNAGADLTWCSRYRDSAGNGQLHLPVRSRPLRPFRSRFGPPGRGIIQRNVDPLLEGVSHLARADSPRVVIEREHDLRTAAGFNLRPTPWHRTRTNCTTKRGINVGSSQRILRPRTPGRALPKSPDRTVVVVQRFGLWESWTCCPTGMPSACRPRS